jgi:hypothetical protein
MTVKKSSDESKIKSKQEETLVPSTQKQTKEKAIKRKIDPAIIRKALGSAVQLVIPKELMSSEYDYRFVANENPNRLSQAQQLGWTFVDDKRGNHYKIYGGRTSQGEFYQFAMKRHKEFSEQVNKIKAEKIAATEQNIRERKSLDGPLNKGNTYFKQL